MRLVPCNGQVPIASKAGELTRGKDGDGGVPVIGRLYIKGRIVAMVAVASSTPHCPYHQQEESAPPRGELSRRHQATQGRKADGLQFRHARNLTCGGGNNHYSTPASGLRGGTKMVHCGLCDGMDRSTAHRSPVLLAADH